MRARVVLLAAVLAAVPACGAQPGSITREEFIDTYVALREAELRGSGNVISEEAIDSVLAEKGVSEEDLEAFVGVHGRDPVFMSAVWSEVESRMADQASPPDSVG